jgi:glycosyltransferase involved in cell wall biosynthesis
MREKKVLFISYYFPPLGMGGVQRSLKFVKYLPSFGWKPLVLTVKEINYFFKDFSLGEEIPKEAEVFQTGSFDPLRISFLIKKLLKKKEGSFKITGYSFLKSKLLHLPFLPDNKIGWLPFALIKSLWLYRQSKFDLIFSTYPPLTSHLLALILKRVFQKPWVADFRDLRVGFEFEKHPTILHKWVFEKIMKLTFRNADKIVTINEKIAERMMRDFKGLKKVDVIYHGYDEKDFENKIPQENQKFTIVYSGTLSLDSNPEPFFKALSNFLQREDVLRTDVKFLHLGIGLGVDLDELIGKYNLKEVVETKGYLSHAEVFPYLLGTSVLLLLISDLRGSELVLTGKTFEYLRVKKPILAIVPENGVTAFLLRSLKITEIISPAKTETIEQALLKFYRKFKQGDLNSEVPEIQIEKFERKFLTSRLAKMFDELVSTNEKN